MSKKYVRKNDGSRWLAPGRGYVAPGTILEGEQWAQFCPALLEEYTEPKPKSKPKPSPKPKPVPQPVPEPVVEVEAEVVVEEMPIDGYDGLNAKDAIAALRKADLIEEELLYVQKHEAENKNRSTVLGEIEDLLEAGD